MAAERFALCIHYVNSFSLFFHHIKLTTQKISSYLCAFKNRLMDWSCLLSYPPPPFSCSLGGFSCSLLYRFIFQGSTQRAFAEHVFAQLFFMALTWTHDLSVLYLYFPDRSQLHTLRNTSLSPWGSNRQGRGLSRASRCGSGCGSGCAKRSWTRKEAGLQAECEPVLKAQPDNVCVCTRHRDVRGGGCMVVSGTRAGRAVPLTFTWA